MIYELRIYIPHDGKLDAIKRRFLISVVPIFERIGIELINVLDPIDDSGEFLYLTRFSDSEAREQAWLAFSNDAEWKVIKAASERDGPLVKKQEARLFRSLFTP